MKARLYRDNGAIGALLDEYEKALDELIELVHTITPSQLIQIVDNETKDADCRSIQTILSHVVRAGYTYVIATRKNLGENIEYRSNETLDSTDKYVMALKEMFSENLKLFADYPNIKMEEHDESKKILTPWGQRFDVDQLYEHAIVHILRHRRQIERFLLKMKSSDN